MRSRFVAKSYCEPLESRRLLSTFVWTNRNTFTGTNDNRFDDVFGSLQNQAIAVVDTAIAFWQRVITNFNFSDGTNTYNLTISMNATGTAGPGVGANGSTTATIGNKPSSGNVAVGWNTGVTPTTDNAAGWYLDPTPRDNSEFTSIVNGFSANATGANVNGGDMLLAMMHEIGHSLGLSSNSTINAFATDTGFVDTINTPAASPPAHLYRFDSAHSHSLWTAWDSGGAGGSASNRTGAQHFAPAGAQVPPAPFAGTYFGAMSLMNATFGTNRSLIDDNIAYMLEDAYGYSIQLPSTFGTFYDTVDADGTLRINTPGNGNDVITLNSSSTPNLLIGITLGSPVAGADVTNPIATVIPFSSVQRIVINTGGGNDIVRIESNAGFPTTVNLGDGNDELDFGFSARDLGIIQGTTTVSGGNGTDQVFMYDSSKITPQTYSVTSLGFNRPGWGGLSYGADLEAETLTTGTAADTVNVTSTATGEPVVLNSAGGNDTVNVANLGLGTQLIRSDVQINNTPSFTTLNINDNGDFTPRTIAIDDWANGYSAIGGIAPAYVTWRNSDTAVVNVTTGNAADTVTVLRNTRPLTLNSAGGPDSITLGNPTGGMQSIVSSVTINSPNGSLPTVTADDRADLTGRSASLNFAGGSYVLGGLSPGNVNLTNVATLTCLSGPGNDTYNFSGTILINLNIDTGPGNDSVFFQGVTNFDRFGNSATASVTGGNDNDNLYIFDQLNTDDWRYDVYSDHVSDDNNVFGLNVNFNIDHLTMNAGSGNDTFDVRDASIFTTTSLNGGSGNDLFDIVSPAGGLGSATCNGDAGSDVLTADESSLGSGMNFTLTTGDVSISQSFLTQDFFNLGIEAINLYGTQDADVFNVNQFTSGAPLAVYGQGGNDTLNLGNGNLSANITGIAAFTYDGQGGSDTFNINNASNTSPWSYIVTNTYVETDRNPGAVDYFLILNNANLEQVNINAGSGNDQFNVRSTNSGENIGMSGGLGNDSLTVGYVLSVANIHSASSFDGGGGTDSISMLPVIDTGPHTFHVTPTSVSAMPGDSLFPAGGSFSYSNSESLNVQVGSAIDTIYAQPSTTTTISIDGGSPSTVPGDVMNLALANSPGYTIHPTSATAGNVTSPGHQTLSWSSIEQPVNVDNVAPAVLNANINLDGVQMLRSAARQQAVDVQFSEGILLLSAASLQLTNLTSGQPVPQANIAVSFDAGTNTAHFTFPGYPGGILPDGNYHGSVIATATTDTFGNAMSANVPFDFFFLEGDANHDRKVDQADLRILSLNWQQPGRTFSQGNFDYGANGVVDVNDLNILASRWQQTLAAPALSPALLPPPSPARQIEHAIDAIDPPATAVLP